MNFINNLSVKAKVTMLLSVSIVSFGILAVDSIKSSAELNESTKSLYEQSYTPLTQISKINELMRANMQEVLLAGYHDPSLEVSKEHEKTHKTTGHLDKIPPNV